MNVSIKSFLSDQIGRKLLIWPHLLKKSLMKNIILCAVLEGQSVFFLEEPLLCSFLPDCKLYKASFVNSECNANKYNNVSKLNSK